jgi:hypothetical protein
MLVVVVAVASCGRGNFEIDADVDGVHRDAPAQAANIAFVTSTTQLPTFGGVAGGDAICAMRATAGGLAGTYVAMLSVAGTDGRNRLANARGWVRPDGKPIADRVEDLFGGTIYYPPVVDETGGVATGALHVATGTAADGTMGSSNCGDFTNVTGTVTNGVASATTYSWLAAGADSCSNPLRLYCFGIDRSVPVTVTPSTGRKAFVSVQTFDASLGVAAADTVCGTDAAPAGLAGTFKAALARMGGSAAARFDLTGPPWVRLDGVQLAPTPLAFMAGPLLAPLNETAIGTYVDGNVWTGATLVSAGQAADTCNDWTTNSSTTTGTSGRAEYIDTARVAGQTGQPCNNAFAVYCLEQ